MHHFFKDLFEYNHHFNQQLAKVFEGSNRTSEKSVKLFNHILNAHQIWNNRIEANQKPFGVWELHAIADFKRIDKTNYEATLDILAKFDLKRSIRYSNSRGEGFHSTIQDMLFHVINHSTYHRGQIASEFKQCGVEPLVTDYVFYKRK